MRKSWKEKGSRKKKIMVRVSGKWTEKMRETEKRSERLGRQREGETRK